MNQAQNDEKPQVRTVYLPGLNFPIRIHGGEGAIGRAIAELTKIRLEEERKAQLAPAEKDNTPSAE